MADLVRRFGCFDATSRRRGGSRRLWASALVVTIVLFGAVAAVAQQPTDAARAEATQTLFDAVQRNDLATVQASIAAGADMSAVNDWGLTPIDLAVDKGYFEIAHFLLSLRGFREASAQAAPPGQATETAPPPIPAPATMPTEASPSVVPPAAPSQPEVAAAPPSPPPVWPANKPNPFDPNAAPIGANLPIVGQVQGPGGAAVPAATAAAWPQAPQGSVRETPAPAAGARPPRGDAVGGTAAAAQPPARVVRDAETTRALAAPSRTLAAVPVPRPAPKQPEIVLAPQYALPRVDLAVGDALGLGTPRGGPPKGTGPDKTCVVKKDVSLMVCLEDVRWPAAMEPHVRVKKSMYKGVTAAVRYDDGRVTRVHALFPAQSFDAVVAYYQRRYGPPSQTFGGPSAPAGQGAPRAVWQALAADGEQAVILDVRKVDDVRSRFPDTEHGAIMLYPAKSPPVFPRLPLLHIKLQLMKGH